jgi:hypothetical protein
MRVVGIGEMRGEIVAAVSWLMLSMWKRKVEGGVVEWWSKSEKEET